jgi:hypothetical protein
MPHPSRRAVLTSAASLAAATALPVPVIALAPPLGRSSALLLEHRRRAAQVLGWRPSILLSRSKLPACSRRR